MASTVIITGASEGIGKATALLLAEKGYDLVLVARSEENLRATASEVGRFGKEPLAIPADVRDAVAVGEMVGETIARYGSIDILVNNAGIFSLGPAEHFSLEEWHRVIDTNLWGYIYTIHALLPHFIGRGTGKIINVGSISGHIPAAYQVPYTVSKYAITGLTESLHAELKPKGIEVSGIYPNLIRSDFLKRAVFTGEDADDADSRRSTLDNALSFPLIEKPEDVARAILKAIEGDHDRILVGSAKLSKFSYALLPGVMQWLFRKTFGTKVS